MAALTLRGQVLASEPVERKAWNAQDWRELLKFVAQCSGIIGAAVFLYVVGPALGMALVVGGLVAWSVVR
jgi:hypothetical protein